jgi:hypothetical protein
MHWRALQRNRQECNTCLFHDTLEMSPDISFFGPGTYAEGTPVPRATAPRSHTYTYTQLLGFVGVVKTNVWGVRNSLSVVVSGNDSHSREGVYMRALQCHTALHTRSTLAQLRRTSASEAPVHSSPGLNGLTSTPFTGPLCLGTEQRRDDDASSLQSRWRKKELMLADRWKRPSQHYITHLSQLTISLLTQQKYLVNLDASQTRTLPSSMPPTRRPRDSVPLPT